jgi:hypothetical protein
MQKSGYSEGHFKGASNEGVEHSSRLLQVKNKLAIDIDYFQHAFVNPCTMLNQRRSWSGVRITAQ